MTLVLGDRTPIDDLRDCFYTPDNAAITSRRRNGRLEVALNLVQNPKDPLRWKILKTIIDSNHVVMLLRRQSRDKVTDYDEYQPSGQRIHRNRRTLSQACETQYPEGVTISGQSPCSRRGN